MRLKPVATLLLLLATGCAKKDINATDIEKKFEDGMSGVTLVGYSTRLDKPGVSGEERYVIEKVSKMTGDIWLFRARLKF